MKFLSPVQATDNVDTSQVQESI